MMAANTIVACVDGSQLAVKIQSMTGDEHTIVVTRDTLLRDVQETICMLCHKPFPSTKACLIIGSHTYDEFMDRPFVDCCSNEVIAVIFTHTDDPYFYDLRDRKHKPNRPPLELEQALAASTLHLPPSFFLE